MVFASHSGGAQMRKSYRETNFEEILDLLIWSFEGSPERSATVGLASMVIFCGLVPMMLLRPDDALFIELFRMIANWSFIGAPF
jgi:hypothetical protein